MVINEHARFGGRRGWSTDRNERGINIDHRHRYEQRPKHDRHNRNNGNHRNYRNYRNYLGSNRNDGNIGYHRNQHGPERNWHNGSNGYIGHDL